MQRIIRKISVAAALLLGMTACAATRASAQTTKYSVFGGYSYGTNNFFNGAPLDILSLTGAGNGSALHGYGAAFTVNFNNHVGLEASFTGHNGSPTIAYILPGGTSSGELFTSDQGLYTYTFGPRLFQTVGDFSLFTHFLVGGVHLSQTVTATCVPGGGSCPTPPSQVYTSESGSGFAFKTGGGVDWNHGRWGIRILEVDYVHGQMLGAFSQLAFFGPPQPINVSTSANNFELTTGITFNFGSSL